MKSRDAAGNLAVSPDQTFVTAAAVIATACDPRPQVVVTTAVGGSGRLIVTVTVGTSSLLPANSVQRLRISNPVNALIDVQSGPTGISGDLDLALPANTQSLSFAIRRAAPGLATTVPFTVVDGCGDWKSLAGGGPSAF
jgi:hypothetical protein